MGRDREHAAWLEACKQLNPVPKAFQPTAADRNALATPATLAAHLDPFYVSRAHTDAMADAIVRLEGEVSPSREGPRLMLDAPPQCGKTHTSVIWSAFWWLCKHPRAQIMIVCYGVELAEERGEAVRRLVSTYGSRYGLHLDPSTHAKRDWKTTSGAAVRCFGVKTGITGYPGDICWIDDLTKNRAEAESPTMRKAIHDAYSADISSRLAPGAPVVVVATRWNCLTAGQPVVTSDGVSLIEDIKPGSQVLTSNGYQPVLATASRLHDGEVVQIRCYGNPDTLSVTRDHRILTRHGWVEAAEIRRDDWLLLPSRTPGGEGISEAVEIMGDPLPPRANPDVAIRGTGELSPATREELLAHLAAGWSYQKISQHYGRKCRSSAYSWCKHYGITRPAGNVLDTHSAAQDPDFWKAVGFWVAEGSITYGRSGDVPRVCRWSFGDHEYETHAKLVFDVLHRHGLTSVTSTVRQPAKLTGLAANWRPDTRGITQVTVSSVQLARLLETFGKGAHVKHLPDLAFRLPPEHAKALVDGWQQGDGCAYQEGRWVRSVSVSHRLLRDFQVLLASLGIPSSFMRSGVAAGADEIRFPIVPVNHYGVSADEAGLWLRVKHVGAAPYQGPVFDIQTPTGDFVASGVLVHNCDDLSGRREREEGLAEQGGRWRKLHLPAICDTLGDALGRAVGDPLPHPKIPADDRESALRHWNEKRRTTIPRDWFALYQGDPKPAEGALVTWELMRQRRCYEFGNEQSCAQPQRIAVAVDPSGGGRDTAGIIGGYLGEDQRLYLTHDRSGAMSSAEWSRRACELAAEIDADSIIVETNYGGDAMTLAIRTAWTALRQEKPDRFSVFCPRIVTVVARRNKLLRAEPIAQQFVEDRVRFAQYLADVESEWGSWVPGPNSPGRIDASVYLAYALLPIPTSGAATITGMRQLASTDLTRGLSPGNMGMIG